MNIEDQVTSLELSKRLKELFVEQDSVFYYIGKSTIIGGNDLSGYQIRTDIMENECSAFTATELGEMLPNRIAIDPVNTPFDSFTICIKKFYTVNEHRTATNNYILNYDCDSTELEGQDAWLRRRLTKNIYDSNLANAMAKMLIYLLENGLIKNE